MRQYELAEKLTDHDTVPCGCDVHRMCCVCEFAWGFCAGAKCGALPPPGSPGGGRPAGGL